MNKTISRRRFAAFAAGLGALAVAPRALALQAPAEKKILTVTGKITATNDGSNAVFDRPMLESLGMHAFETTAPWFSGVVRFEGVLMSDLMTAVGATGDTVKALALDDFSTEMPVSDYSRYGTLLALKRNGSYMSVRDKGPLFIVYPYDSAPELHSQRFYSRSAWQLKTLIVS